MSLSGFQRRRRELAAKEALEQAAREAAEKEALEQAAREAAEKEALKGQDDDPHLEELRQWAKELGIKNYYNMKSDTLAQKIAEAGG